MNKKLVSIIMPVYQAEKFLCNTINSVLAQTYSNWELILVNDGSTDSSGEICDAYTRKDNRIRVIHQLNAGQASARNSGMDLARGDYIGFLDNDDFYYPDAVKILINNIEEADADIAAGSYVARDENGKITHDIHNNEISRWNNYEAMKEFLARENMDIYVWTKLYRRTFLNKNHIRFEEGRCDEDFLFNSKAFLYANFTVMQDSPICLYIIRNSSTSRIFQNHHFHKYLDGTIYRVNKIEQMVAKHYSSLTYLAKRQKILYLFMMLSVIVKYDRKEYAIYYDEIITYLKINKKQMLAEHQYCGVSFLGALLIIIMPSSVYFYFKRWRGVNISVSLPCLRS